MKIIHAGPHFLVSKPEHGDPDDLRFWYGVPTRWLVAVRNDRRNSERIRKHADTILTQRRTARQLYAEMFKAVKALDPDLRAHHAS